MSKPSVEDRVMKLKETLRTEKNFGVPWDYFHDELAMDDDFMSLGKQGSNQIIDASIAHIAKRHGGPGAESWLPTTHIKEFGLWHGFRTFGAASGIFFYYQDSCQGLMGVMSSLTGPTDLYRLSSIAYPG